MTHRYVKLWLKCMLTCIAIEVAFCMLLAGCSHYEMRVEMQQMGACDYGLEGYPECCGSIREEDLLCF